MTDNSTTDGNGQGGRYRQQVEERRRQAQEEMGSQENEAGSDLSSTFVMDCLQANELGDGMLFAAIHQGKFRYAKNLGEWFEWAGDYWQRDTMGNAYMACEDVARRYLQEREQISQQVAQAAGDGNENERQRLEALRGQLDKRINRLRSQRGRTNTLAFAHTCQGGLGIIGDELDSNPWLLAVENGVIDLRTGHLRSGHREDYVTMASSVPWEGIDAPAETWERALLEIFNNNQDLVDFMRRALGYALLGIHLEDVFLVLSGQGRNGKSLLVETVRWILGDLAGPIPAELLLDQGRARSSTGPSPDIMTLKGLRMAIASETDQGQRISPNQVKWLTGGDTLVGRHPHDKYLTSFSPTHTLFLLTNHKPHAPADDYAFWERVLLIPFELSFVDREPSSKNERRQDKHLKTKLRDEAPGILAWLVRGCLEYQKQGLNPPLAVKSATAEYRRDEDILADFLDECCIQGEKLEADASALYEEFETWFQKNVGKRVWSQRAFGRAMSKKFERIKRGTYKYLGVGLING